MREGASEAFRREVNRANSRVIPFVELLRTEAEAVVDTNTEWGDADSLTGILRRNGQIVLTGSTTTHVEHTTGTDETLIDLVNPVGASALSVAAVQWDGSGDVGDREIHAVTARLDPASNGANNVARWKMRMFRLYSAEQDGERSVNTRWHLQSKGSTVTVTAGAIQADVEFELASPVTVGDAPIVDPNVVNAVAGDAPTVPVTVIVVWGEQADGSIATSGGWVTDDSDDQKTLSGYTVSRYDLDEPTAGSYAGLAFRNTGTSNGVPRFALIGRSYSAQTATFTSNPLDLGASPDSASVLELVGEGRARGGIITYEIHDGSSWIEYVDGDQIGVDRSALGGSDLSGVSRTQTYDMRVTLTPSTVGASPIVSRIGVREIGASEYAYDVVDFGSVTWAVDPITGASEVPETDVTFLVDGKRDYRSLIEDTLASYHAAALQLRVWMGDPNAYRSEWLHIDDFLVDDYQAKDGAITVTCVSPLSLIKRQIPEATGSTISAITYLSDTPADIYDDLVVNQVGVPDRYVGQGVTATTPTLSREIAEVIQGRDAIEHVARIGGEAVISSQGKLKAVPFFGSNSPEADDLTLFTLEETNVVGFSPGYRTRVTSAVVKYGWDNAASAFTGSRRAENDDAINNLGRSAIDLEEQINEELCKWFEGATDSGAFATGLVEAFGPGMKLVRLQSAIRRPWLEPGDAISVESDLFVGRDPVTGVGVRGPMIAYATVQAVNDVEGSDITAWIRSWEDIVPSETAQDLEGFVRPEIGDFTYSFDTSGDLIVTIQASQAAGVRVAASDSAFPSEATVDGTSVTALSADGWAEINLGGSFGSEVFLAARATETASGGGGLSAYTVSKTFKVGYIEAEGGTIGGWSITDTDLIAGGSSGVRIESDTRRILMGAATAPVTGIGIFLGLDGSDWEFRAGNPAGDMIHWDGTDLTITGEITATSGEIGGWSINATDIFSGNIALESDTERILIGSATAPLTGAGVFLGLSGGEYQFRAGDPGGDYLLWDGSALVLSGQIVDSGNLVDGAVDSLQMADEAVVAAKLANYAVGGVKMDGTARSQHGVFMETWDDEVAWTGAGGSSPGTRSFVSGAGITGGVVYQAVGQRWDVFSENIPYDPSKLYRVRVRARRTATADAATQRFYCGVNGVAADGSTLINTAGSDSTSSQHYIAASAVDASAWTLNEWQEYTGWFSGHGTSGIASGRPATNPSVLYDGVRYFRPMFIANYNTGPAGNVMQVDYIVVDVFDEDGLVRSYLGLNVDGVVAADRVVAASVATGELNATHISSLSFSGKTATFDTGSIGGWVMSAGALSSGDVTIDAANERITMGAASAPLTGIGIFAGDDGSGEYDFRVGDPAGDYMHWDASAGTLTIKGTLDGVDGTFSGTVQAGAVVATDSFTASAPVFTGSMEIEGGSGTSAIRLSAPTSARALLSMRASGTEYGALEVEAAGMVVRSGTGVLLALDADTEIQIRQDVLPLTTDSYDIGSTSERFLGIYANTIDVDGFVADLGGVGGTERIGFFNKSGTPIQQPIVTGSRSGGAALTDLLAELDALGLIEDQSTA